MRKLSANHYGRKVELTLIKIIEKLHNSSSFAGPRLCPLLIKEKTEICKSYNFAYLSKKSSRKINLFY